MKKSILRGSSACLTSLMLLAFSACNGPSGADGGTTGQSLGTDHVASPPAIIPASAQNPADIPTTPAPISTPILVPVVAPSSSPAPLAGPTVIGDTCHTSDANHVCLALKYVPYIDTTGQAVISQADAIKNVQGINSAWTQCNLGFQIEEYAPTLSTDHGLTYRTANSSELDVIRSNYENDHTLLVVTTGTWDRSGSLGNTGANAWTNLPGGNVFGAILERPVGTFAYIIAHELGHYLNLDHVSDSSNLMNPIIYSNSNQLYTSQCTNARSAVNYFWNKMKR